MNELLEGEDFDSFVEGPCRKLYAARMGSPSLVPGVYFCSLLIAYFEGIDSERGIAWRRGGGGDKGYHSGALLTQVKKYQVRGYISEQ